ncbi:MAG: LacI family DNA-binding transcriptional regulator [Eubacteriales bacterium]|nr:LacI family DNA-binding transcriptional regulator [Eubacteriales bacterium]
MSKYDALNIKQIAELSGVSVATVSRVINQNGRFSSETEARVRRVIEESGYVPNFVAKSLRTSKNHVIGIIVPDILNSHFAGLVLELEKKLFAHGYSTVICNTNESIELEKKHIDTLIAQQVSGVIFISGTKTCKVTQDIPAVYLDRRPASYCEPSDRVLIESDNRTGGYLATQKLIESGCRNIAVFCSRDMDTNQQARFIGYQEALAESGLSCDEAMTFDLHEVSILQARDEMLRIFPSIPNLDGVLCMTDTIALGVITGLHELNITIPEQVSVTGFDDAPLAAYFQPPLTTIRQDIGALSGAAVESLIKMINGEKLESQHVVVPVSLVVRKSTRQQV